MYVCKKKCFEIIALGHYFPNHSINYGCLLLCPLSSQEECSGFKPRLELLVSSRRLVLVLAKKKKSYLYTIPVILPSSNPLLFSSFPPKPAASAPSENPTTCSDAARAPAASRNCTKLASCCPI